MKKQIIFTLVVVGCAVSSLAIAQDSSTQQLQQKLQTLNKLSTSLPQQGLTADQAQQATSQVAQQSQQVSSKTEDNSDGSAASGAGGDMSAQAFAGVVTKKLPLTPKQIEALHTAFNQSQKAAAAPTGVPPRPSTGAIQVDLAPNSTPPVIRLGAGYISSLVFMDATGQPWPIQAYSVGDPNSYNIQWNKTGNTLLVQADTFYKRSNLAVILRGMSTPIMLTLLPGQTAIDYRVDIRVPAMGPNAELDASGLPSAANPVLMDVLNGVPPKNARTLEVQGSNSTQAWLLNDRLYLRTDLEVISPAWTAVMSSVDGTHAYEMQPSSVLLALRHGRDKVIKLILQGLG